MTSTHSTRIGILGAGAVGRALGQGWAEAGHDVRYGARTPAAADEMSVADAAAWADVVVLAVPFGALADIAAEAGPCTGKVLIDCTNPLGMVDGRLALVRGFTTSGGEYVASLWPAARVVKTLNQTGAENMARAKRFATRPVMFAAGDDAEAVAIAMGLVGELGFEPVAAGPLVIARLLEPFAMLWIDQALVRGAGRDFAFVRTRPD